MESPGYGAVTVMVPPVLPVKLTVQVPLAPLGLSAQLALAGDTPAPLAVTLKVPEGAVLLPLDESITLTLQLLDCPVMTGVAQVTVVVVSRFTSLEPFPLLVECVASPP